MEELKKRLHALFYGLPEVKVDNSRCIRCDKLIAKSSYYKERYDKTKESLLESEELLNLAVSHIDLRKMKNLELKNRLNTRRFNG